MQTNSIPVICNVYAVMYYMMSNHVVSIMESCHREIPTTGVCYKTKYKCLTLMNHVLREQMKFTLFSDNCKTI